MYKTPRLGLHYYLLFFGILFAIAIFSLPLMATLLNVHQHQVMAQTQNGTNNNTKLTKAAITTPNSTRLTVPDIVLPINLTKPSTIVKFKGSVPVPNDSLKFYIIQNPSNGNLNNVTGKLGNVTGNSVTYTPNAGFIGQDKFKYSATDKLFGLSSHNGTVTLDHPPTVSNRMNSINGTKPVKILLVGSDPDRGDKLTFSLVQKPLNALLSDPSGNLTTYAPNPGFIGQDKFTFRAKDSAGLPSNNGTVTINVGKPLATTILNVTGPPVPTSSTGALTGTVLFYVAIVAFFMLLPLVYDMFKTYNQKGKLAARNEIGRAHV